jgi:hypothetical protein
MELYISKNDEKLGPLDIDEVQALLSDGKLTQNDLAWHGGISNWTPLSDIHEISGEPKASSGASAINVDRKSDSAQTKPMASLSRDIRNLKSNTSNTAAEVRSFLAEMQGKSPREMLGVIAQSDLVGSLLVSTAIICFLLVAFTGMAFALGDDEAQPTAASTGPAPANQPAQETNGKPPTTGITDNSTPAEKAAKAMKVDQKKKGDPKEPNLFDGKNSGDDILNDLKGPKKN